MLVGRLVSELEDLHRHIFGDPLSLRLSILSMPSESWRFFRSLHLKAVPKVCVVGGALNRGVGMGCLWVGTIAGGVSCRIDKADSELRSQHIW